MPFWHGDGTGRPLEFGRAIGAFTREIDAHAATSSARSPACRARTTSTSAPPATSLAYLADQQARPPAPSPTDRTIVVERFRDELGDWRVCILSPVRRSRPRALGAGYRGAARRATAASMSQTIWSDDGIAIRFAGGEEPPDPRRSSPTRRKSRNSSSRGSPTRRCSPRTSARTPPARSCCRARAPGARTPLWMQRQRAADLLAVASRYGSLPDHPRDLPRVPARCLRPARRSSILAAGPQPRDPRRPGRHARGLAVRRARSSSTTSPPTCTKATRRSPSAAPRPSPSTATCCATSSARPSCASCSTPSARRASSSSSSASTTTAARNADQLTTSSAPRRPHGAEVAARIARPAQPRTPGSAALEAQHRACRVRIAGEERWIAAEDAGRFRDALGVSPPLGCPQRLPRSRPTRRSMGCSPATRARTRPFLAADARRALGHPRIARPRGARAPRSGRPRASTATSGPAAANASGATPTSCARCGADRSPGSASEVEPVDRAPRALPRPVAGPRPAPPTGSTACATSSSSSQGVAVPGVRPGARRPPRARPRLPPQLLDELWRRGRGRLGRPWPPRHGRRPRRALPPRHARRFSAPRRARPRRALHAAHPRPAREPGALFFADLVARPAASIARQSSTRSGTSSGRARSRTTRFAPLRALRLAASARPARGPGASPARSAASRRRRPAAGRSCPRPREPPRPPPRAPTRSPALLLDRYGVRHARGRRGRGHRRRLLRRLPRAQSDGGGRARPPRLLRRRARRGAVRAPGRGRSPARRARTPGRAARSGVLAATDPANPYGAALPWPRRRRRRPAALSPARRRNRRPRRRRTRALRRTWRTQRRHPPGIRWRCLRARRRRPRRGARARPAVGSPSSASTAPRRPSRRSPRNSSKPASSAATAASPTGPCEARACLRATASTASPKRSGRRSTGRPSSRRAATAPARSRRSTASSAQPARLSAPQGKNLLISFDNGLALRGHLRMYGTVARLRARRERGRAGARGAPRARSRRCHRRELQRARHRTHRRTRARPSTRPSPASARTSSTTTSTSTKPSARLRDPARAQLTIGDAIMDQRAIAGVGNIWKHESLFNAGVNPWRRVGELDDDTLGDLIRRARALLRASIGKPNDLDINHRPSMFVYMRGGQPCRRCHTRFAPPPRASTSATPAGAQPASPWSMANSSRPPAAARPSPAPRANPRGSSEPVERDC